MKALSKAWFETAQDDLDTATYNFEGKKYLWAVFICQQAVEKAIKAVIYEQTGVLPPKKHDLMALARKAGLLGECSKERQDFLRRLSIYYIETRYSEDKEALAVKCTEAFTRTMLEKTREVVHWLESKLK